MHWTIAQFPELDHLTPEQRAALLRGVPWWTYRVIRGRALVVGLIVGGVVFGSTWDVLRSDLRMISTTAAAVATMVGVYLLQMSHLRRLMRVEIAAAFKGERPPFCFHCGYDLRAGVEPRCPECGQDACVVPRP
jgi:hypothetical protein